MFILRRITSENNESNTCLGSIYHLTVKNSQTDEFFRSYKAYLGLDPDEIATEDFKKNLENDVYAFITHDLGKEIIPLFKKSQYYVMVGDGKTFSNLTFKD